MKSLNIEWVTTPHADTLGDYIDGEIQQLYADRVKAQYIDGYASWQCVDCGKAIGGKGWSLDGDIPERDGIICDDCYELDKYAIKTPENETDTTNKWHTCKCGCNKFVQVDCNDKSQSITDGKILTPQALDDAILIPSTSNSALVQPSDVRKKSTAHIGALCEVQQSEVVADKPKANTCAKCGKARKIVNDGMCWECNGYLDRTEMLEEVYKRCFPGMPVKYSSTNIALMTKIVQGFGCRRMIDLCNYADWIGGYYRHPKRNWHLNITSLGKPDMWGAFMAEMATQPPFIDAPLYAEPTNEPTPEQLAEAAKITPEELEELERKALARFTLQDIDTKGMKLDDYPDTL